MNVMPGPELVLAAAALLAGAGLLLLGLLILRETLGLLCGTALRALLPQCAGNAVLSLLGGLCTGAVRGAPAAAWTASLALAEAGLLRLRRPLPLLAGIAAGTLLPALPALVPLDDRGAMAALGVGVLLNVVAPRRWRSVSGLLLGLGLIVGGMAVLRNGFVPLAGTAVSAVAVLPGTGLLLCLLLGAALGLLIAQPACTTGIAAAAVVTGVLAAPQALLLVAGDLAAAVVLAALTAPLALRARLLLLLLLLPLAAAAGSGLLFSGAAFPLLLALFAAGVMLVALLFSPLRLAAASAPASHLPAASLVDTATALDLIACEQVRYVQLLSGYLEAARTRLAGDAAAGAAAGTAAQAAVASLDRALDRALTRQREQTLAAPDAGRLFNLQRRRELLNQIALQLDGLTTALIAAPADGGTLPVLEGFVEGLDALLLVAADAAGSRRIDDSGTLLAVTADRSDVMTRVRATYLGSSSTLAAAERELLLEVITRFSRAVLLLHQYAEALTAPDAL